MLTNNAYFHLSTKGKHTSIVHLLEITARSGVPPKWTRMENMFPENMATVDQGALKVGIHNY